MGLAVFSFISFSIAVIFLIVSDFVTDVKRIKPEDEEDKEASMKKHVSTGKDFLTKN